MKAKFDDQYPSWVPETVSFPSSGDLGGWMADHCDRYADRIAFSCAGEDLSYQQLKDTSARFAAHLRSECGLQKGDRVAVMLPNVLAYPIALMGILRAGLILVNVNPLYTARELQHQLTDAGAKALVTAAPFLPLVDAVAQNTPVDAVIEAPMVGLWQAKAEDATHRAFVSAIACNATLSVESIQPTDVAMLQYTGGTTGPSKGAVLSHGNLLANQEQLLSWIAPAFDGQGDESLLAITALPLYHIFALAFNGLAMMSVGATNVLVPNPRDVAGLVALFDKYPVGVFAGVNTLFNGLLHTPGFDQVDFSSMRLVVGGGAAVQAPIAEKWRAVTGSSIIEGYGMSETAPLISLNSIHLKTHNGTVGFAMPSSDVVLLDENDKLVAEGEPGEFCVKGPQVMSGYWNRPDLADETFTADGYFRTGDVAVKHANGCYQLVDRKKDMILVSGFNVYPTEIEEVVASHPQVLECACIGEPDDKTGEAVKVFAVKSNADLTADEVLGFCRENLTAYKVPKEVIFIDEVPKSPVGKILRRELRPAA